MSKYSGECYCGAVKFYCDGDPFFTQYCHCNKCREVASQSQRDEDKKGYAWTAGYLTSSFHITSGVEKLDEVIRNNAKLLLCKTCRGLIYGISLIQTSKQVSALMQVIFILQAKRQSRLHLLGISGMKTGLLILMTPCQNLKMRQKNNLDRVIFGVKMMQYNFLLEEN